MRIIDMKLIACQCVQRFGNARDFPVNTDALDSLKRDYVVNCMNKAHEALKVRELFRQANAVMMAREYFEKLRPARH